MFNRNRIAEFGYQLRFHKHTELTIMTILASEALLRKNKNPTTKCYPTEHEAMHQPFRSNALLSEVLKACATWDVFKLSFIPAPLQSWT